MKTEFKSIEELTEEFAKGWVDIKSDIITVSGIKFSKSVSSSFKLVEMIDNKKGYIVYSTTEEDNLPKELKEHIAFIWALGEDLHFVPWNVKISSSKNVNTDFLSEDQDQRVIGSTVKVRFVEFHETETSGKVDTGATMSSLHCTKWKVSPDKSKVTFVTPVLSENSITMDLQDMQAVRTSDNGAEYRPVVAFKVSVNGMLLDNVVFNLNDRSEMDSKILIGQNILEKGKFLIDPTMERYEISFVDDNVQQAKRYIPTSLDEIDFQRVETFVNLLKEYDDITLFDITKYIKTKTLKDL